MSQVWPGDSIKWKSGVLDIYLSTNGSLLKGSIVEKLIFSGLTRIQVSIDAYTKQTFDKIRQGGNFDEVVENTLNFINKKKELKLELPTVRVNFVKTELNKHEYSSFIDFWSDKADCIGVQNIVNIINPTKSNKNFVSFNCAQPFYHLTLRYDGSILPCCTFFGAKLPIAKIKTDNQVSKEKNLNDTNFDKLPTQSIIEAWNNSEINEIRDLHLKGEYYKNKFCNECVLSTSNADDNN